MRFMDPPPPKKMASNAARSLGRIVANRTFVFVCDMQEKFKPSIRYFPEIATVAQRLVRNYRRMIKWL